jgi:transposase
MDIIRVGIDLAKNVFQVHGVDRTEKTVWRRKLACDEWLDIQMARRRTDALSLWVMRIVANRHPNVAAVALANKTARIAWAMITREMDYQPELAAQ